MTMDKGLQQEKIRIRLFDNNKNEIRTILFPISDMVFFAYRIIQEEFSETEKIMGEPCFRLTPMDTPIERSEHPCGPTSITGGRYQPDLQENEQIQYHPDSDPVFFKFEIIDYHRTVFKENYTADDIFIHVSQILLEMIIRQGDASPEIGPFYYSVDFNGVDYMEAPLIYRRDIVGYLHALVAPPDNEAGIKKKFTFTKIAEKPLDIRDPAEFETLDRLGGGEDGPGMIVIRPDVLRELERKFTFSRSVECGGFLLGKPFRQPGSAENPDDPDFTWLIDIELAVQAEETLGNAVYLVFTGESWSHINHLLDTQYKDLKIVGWFHTHLFSAEDGYGLSSLDHNLHHRFLHRPWQIALLINIGADGRREIRCFQVMQNGVLSESPYYILQEEP